MKPILYFIIPCYNEEKVIPITHKLFSNKLCELINSEEVSEDSRILYVNDGSKDNTWKVIQELCEQSDITEGLCLSRNFGHQHALWAGLMEATKADITISLDCDGQDDINAAFEMITAYKNGADIVYGVRNDRSSDSFFKRNTALAFYRFMDFLGAGTIYNHADYRLLDRRVIDALSQFDEVNIFIRGIIPLVGFNSSIVYYERHERLAGTSHYPFKKMFNFAIDGITSLSVKPIRLITSMGLMVSLLGFIGIIWAIITYIIGNTVAGWSSMLCIICFLGGIQLLSLGVIGEYIGKIYLETKHRPKYIVKDKIEK